MAAYPHTQGNVVLRLLFYKTEVATNHWRLLDHICWCSSEAEQRSCKAQVVISKFTTSSILEPSIVTVAISNAFAQCGLDYTNVRLWACISMGESVPCKDEVACSSHVRSTNNFFKTVVICNIYHILIV